MSLSGSQQKIFLRLVAALSPHWRRDPNLPTRINELFAANRAFGSRDRRLYRELIYTTVRFLPWIEPLLETDPARAATAVAWLAADLPATRAYRAELCHGWPPCPPSVAAKANHLKTDALALLPDWLPRHCADTALPAELDALHTRAPLWLRLQTPSADATAEVLAEFTAAGWTFRRSAILPRAIQLLTEGDVTKTKAWERGWVEIQDLGSQLILESAGIAAGGRWLDACAGAGGKTLQLAALVGATGHVDAFDIRPSALRELKTRADRAGLTNVAVLAEAPLPPAQYDGVLIDAPCSGSGTWRRSPYLKWTTTPGQITHAAETQLALLTASAALVRPGGRLVYATCSLSRMENEDVVAAFLAAHTGFDAEPPAHVFAATPRHVGLAILPSQHNSDGFYVASLRRRAS
jgi:16S rRNA (cytosine967-C5)-methyltransferase